MMEIIDLSDGVEMRATVDGEPEVKQLGLDGRGRQPHIFSISDPVSIRLSSLSPPIITIK